jgi:hypothetical protein
MPAAYRLPSQQQVLNYVQWLRNEHDVSIGIAVPNAQRVAPGHYGIRHSNQNGGLPRVTTLPNAFTNVSVAAAALRTDVRTDADNTRP